MPKPTADHFARLGALVAIDDAASRPTRPVLEAFSGTEMATIPVATADDLEVAVARARQAQQGWAARTPADAPRSSTVSPTWSTATRHR